MSRPPIQVPPEDRTFVTGARRDSDHGKPRLDFLPWHALRSLGGYMRESAARFGACNYRRGMPLSELNASMLRHAADYQTADTRGEEIKALHGVLFNASVALEQILLDRDDLDDMDVIRDGAWPDAEYVGRPRVSEEWPDDEADVHSVITGPQTAMPRESGALPEPKVKHVVGKRGFGSGTTKKERRA